MALPIWGGLILYGWINTTNEIFTHLLPQRTPLPLLIFMVLIEIISSLIRPLTLRIRLAANIIAGHLLLALLGGQIHLLIKIQLLSVRIAQLILISLELAVALIQAYVFTILLTLYIREINY
jgi:F-type H+-transporting ATPase subunit a